MIIPKLLFRNKLHPYTILYHHFILKIIEILNFQTDTKSSGADTVLNRQLRHLQTVSSRRKQYILLI